MNENDQGDSRKPSQGHVITPRGGISTVKNIAKVARIVGGLGSTFWIVIGAIAGVSIFTFILTSATGEAANLNSNETNPSNGAISSDITACYFYRGGDPISAAKISSPQLSSIIADVAAKTGVPASIIAGVMRVESGDRLSSTDQSYFDKDYDYHTSGVAFGIMQFTPPTFDYVFNSNKDILKTSFGKDSVETSTSGTISPTNVFRIYSIKDSIAAAGLKIKGDKKSINGDGPWDESTIRKIAGIYYGGGITAYGNGQDYGSDLWKSYSGCNITSSVASSCPIPGGTVTCGSSATSASNCSHCGKGYVGSCNYEGIHYAIDVALPVSKTGDPVFLPQIKGHNVLWKFLNESAGGSGAIQTYTGTDQATQEKYYIEFHHTLTGTGAGPGKTLLSGGLGGNICGAQCETKPHVHIELGSGEALKSNYLDAALNLCR